MNPEDLKLSSVNWEHGMLLSPEHFLRQEAYIDSALLWVVRYVTDAYGLVGGGPRVPESERGAVRHDPVVLVDDDAEAIRLAVTQCRGLTPSGCVVEIDSQHPLQCRVSKAELEGVAEALVYIVCDPHRKDVLDGVVDQFNPQMKTERRSTYRLTVEVPADRTPYSVVVARLRRHRYGTGYEKDPAFIPPCTSMASYSELAAAWRTISETVHLLAARYTDLHRAMREFLVLFAERGIDTGLDVETMRFAERMVTALQDCVYDVLDPVQPPRQFFGRVRRFLHGAAVNLDLTPAVQQYFDTLKDTGETEFIAPLEQQRDALKSSPRWDVHSDLGAEARSALQSLNALLRLERALEGKYLDFRLSPSLESMNFIFDRGGKVLYKLAAKPSRVQGVGDELTVYFAQLRLEGRDRYRVVLIGAQGATFEKGVRIDVEIRINEGAGFRRSPLNLSYVVANGDQRNFEFDFDAPDVPTIADLKISLQAHLPIRTALLFARHRFFAGQPAESAHPVEPLRQVVEPLAGSPSPPPLVTPAIKPQPEPGRGRSRLEPHNEPAAGAPPDRDRAPWDQPPPPRRRRLE
jgi:hypothetical protein